MDLFSILKFIGGISMFLFGMSVMGKALERRAGNKLRSILEKLTDNVFAGVLTGLLVTAVIQSSSATTVMVVGFVNSGLMSLRQAINVIMGANIGTTVTAWLLSLSGISSENIFIQLLKPTSFTPILALFGIILYLFSKNDKRRESGLILLGFAILMFGMDSMSGSVAGLKESRAFGELFLLFSNPVLGVIAGAVLTGIIQSSSASVGILQALASTGKVTYGAAIPIIMGQNIGTCVTALLSAIGANKNARRTALAHLTIKLCETVVFLVLFCIIRYVAAPEVLSEPASMIGIAVAHSAFNVCGTIIMLPMRGLIEKLVMRVVPEEKDNEDQTVLLDTRLLSVPSLALGQGQDAMRKMLDCSCRSVIEGIEVIKEYDPEKIENVRKYENDTDHYEDILGTYLVALSAKNPGGKESEEVSGYLKLLADFERIADHGVSIAECGMELHEKKTVFSDQAKRELEVLFGALKEIVTLCREAFENNDFEKAQRVEPLSRVIDDLKEQIRTRHVIRLQQGICSIDTGFVLSDMLMSVERIARHCSNIAGTVMDIEEHNINIHESLREYRRESDGYRKLFHEYAFAYALARSDGQ